MDKSFSCCNTMDTLEELYLQYFEYPHKMTNEEFCHLVLDWAFYTVQLVSHAEENHLRNYLYEIFGNM